MLLTKKGVIIVGYTRYYAARQLAYSEVPVVIADLPKKKQTKPLFDLAYGGRNRPGVLKELKEIFGKVKKRCGIQ